MSLLNGLLWGFLRHWFGGGFDEKYKWLGDRGLQTAVMVAAIFAALYDRTIWWVALLLAVWIQFQFWSRAVGEILDCGRSPFQNAESYDRWYRVPLDWVYDKLGRPKYIGMYDWWYGWLRYGLPMIVPAAVLGDWSFIIIGLAGSPVYYSCWELFERFPKMLEWPEWCGEPKNLAELIYGFIFGVMLW